MSYTDDEVDHETLPLGSYDLIKMLDRRHPHRNLGRNEDVLDAHRRSAVRDFIDALILAMDEDIEDMKDPPDANHADK